MTPARRGPSDDFELFQEIAASPVSWWRMAESHFAIANHLYGQLEKWNEGWHPGRADLVAGAYDAMCVYLALSLEVGCKALLIHRGEICISTDGEQLTGALARSHNLRALVQQAKLSEPPEGLLLDALTAAGVWAGRYPSALTTGHFTFNVFLEQSPAMRFAVRSLLRQVRACLMSEASPDHYVMLQLKALSTGPSSLDE